MTYRFGPFTADRTSYRVSEGSRAVEMTPKLLDLLFYFLDRPAVLVTKEELLEGVWPDANVTDNALAQAISDLRDALGDTPSAPRFIKTVARRGYRFVTGVTVDTPAPRPTPALDPHTIAVLDFTNVSNDPDVAWLGAGIAETVSSDLGSLGRFRVVDRWRVVAAVRATSGSMHDIGPALGAGKLVTGSFQRNGPNIRITARVVDLDNGEAIADAKVDGPLADIFTIQDHIVATFAQELGVTTLRHPAKLGVRETSNLDAYRAFIEGNLKIESLSASQVRASIADFERAISLDPRYALAYTGLANAELVAYEVTRLLPAPDRRALESGIDHARHALKLDPRLAEAHATLAFLLTSAGKYDQARSAAQQAVALEPDNWRHQYRLGHASWGDTRVRALGRALDLYPQFAYARFEMALVEVARGQLERAEELVSAGVVGQDLQQSGSLRFPAIGLHWLLGLLRAAQGDPSGAHRELDRELAQNGADRLYGPEYAAAAHVAKGQVLLAESAAGPARLSFEAALTHVTDYPAAWIGLSVAHQILGQRSEANAARERSRQRIAALRVNGHPSDFALLAACNAAVQGDRDAAIGCLEPLVSDGPASVAGWSIPIEPFLRPLHSTRGFADITSRLAARAS